MNNLKLNNIKKLVFAFLAIITVISFSCKKSDTPDPSENVTYTVKYSVVSTGDVTVDTIIYLNSNGVEETLLNQNQFSHSFNSENSYHGKLYISGSTTNNGNCEYGFQILQGDDVIKDNSSGSQSSTPVGFTFSGEFSYSEN